MKWTDGEIDKLYQERSENLSFEYKNDYWEEFSDSMPYVVSGESDFNMADSEIDELYKTKAKDLSFTYKSSYWKEMAAMLPQRRKRDAIWYVTSFVFMGLLVMTPFVGQNETEANNANNLLAKENNATILSETNNSDDALVDMNSEQVVAYESVNNEANSNLEAENVTTTNHNSTHNRSSNPANDLAETDRLTPRDGQNNIPGNIDQNRNAELPINMLSENTIGNADESSELAADGLIASNSEAPDGTQRNIDGTSDEIGNLAVKTLEGNEIYNEIIDLNGSIPPLKVPRVTNFYVEMNGGISQSLISPSEKISFALGVGIGTQIQKGRFTFTTGVNGLLSYHEDLELSRQAKVYGFGSETFSYQLHYKQIYSL